MKPFKNLTEEENNALLKFPVLVSLLAANSDGKLDEAERKAAIKFSHIKTYSCNPLLVEFYKEADMVFEKNVKQLDMELPTQMAAREAALKNELIRLENILLKLGEEYAAVMHRSMNSFKDHVSKAHHNVLMDFVFPMPIKGLTY